MSHRLSSFIQRRIVSGAYPLGYQVACALLAILALTALLLGPARDELNPGSYLIWYVWWPLLPFSFLIFGRVWCAFCPITLFLDRLDSVNARRFRAPALPNRWAMTIAVLLFLLVHLFNLRYGFEENIIAGRRFLLIVLGMALGLSALLSARLWCQTLCPIGGLGAMFSTLSRYRIRNAHSPCSKQCGRTPRLPGQGVVFNADGPRACPAGLEPCSEIDFGLCNCCGQCVRQCAGGVCGVARSMETRRPGTSSFPFVLSAFGILGVALDITVVHLAQWPVMFWINANRFGFTPSAWLEMGIHVMIIGVPGAVASVLSLLTRRRKEFLLSLGIPVLMLGAATLVALSLRPLFVVGPQNLKTILLSAGVESARWLSNVHRLDGTVIRVLQIIVLLLGFARALHNRVFPQMLEQNRSMGAGPAERVVGSAFLAGLSGVLIWIFSRPMLN